MTAEELEAIEERAEKAKEIIRRMERLTSAIKMLERADLNGIRIPFGNRDDDDRLLDIYADDSDKSLPLSQNRSL